MDYASLGKQIREHRLAKGLTQEKLAEMAGIEPSNLSHIERAATKVSLPTLVRIANALEATLDELIYGSLVKNTHISAKLIEELLSDCTPEEAALLVEFTKSAKAILRNKQH